MKTINKTIAIAIIAMAMCTVNTYAEWFGIGGGKPSGWSIMDDDDLPEVYMDHDYDGRGLMPDMGNIELKDQDTLQDLDQNAINKLKERIDNAKTAGETQAGKSIGELKKGMKKDSSPTVKTAKGDKQLLYGSKKHRISETAQNNNLRNWEKNANTAITNGGKTDSKMQQGQTGILPTTNEKSEKIILNLSAILNAGTISVFAPYNITTDENKLLDMPLTIGMESFSNVLYTLRVTVLSLCQILCMINILFQAFKLWFGVQEVKKFYVDAIWKTVCCMALLAIYPATVDGVITIASGMGIHMGNGYNDINNTYKKAVSVVYKHMNDGMREFYSVVRKTQQEGPDGKMYIGPNVYKSIKNLDTDSINTIMQTLNINAIFRDEELVDSGVLYTYTYRDSDGTTKTLVDKDNGIIDHPEIANFYDKLEKKEKAILKNNKTQTEKVEQLVDYTSRLYALSQVMDLDPVDLVDPSTLSSGELAQSAISTGQDNMMANRQAAGEIVFKNFKQKWVKPILAPFLKNQQGKRTTILSPAAMVKMCLVFSDAITLSRSYSSEDIANSQNNNAKPEGADKEYNPDNKWFFPNVKKMVYDLLVLLGMLICVTLVMADYTITIIEYYIVTSLGVLLIPMMFLDATKEYTKNLLKLFLQYFFKIMVQAATVFFTMSMYLHLAMRSFTSMDMENTSDLSTYVGVLIVGVLICSTTGKIASALLSGQPSMSVGDIAHQAHHMMAAGRMAAGAVSGAGHFIGGKRGADGRLHGGMLGAGRAAFRAGSHHSQNTAAKRAGGAAAKATAMNNFGTAGVGYQSAKGGVGGGQFFSNQDLQAMKEGKASSRFGSAEAQKKTYAALQNEAGERASKGFQHQASSQWWANAAYKFATNGEEKIMDGQKERFTGVGSRTIDKDGRETTGNQLNQTENMTAAGEKFGGKADALSFFQKPPTASPLPSRAQSSLASDRPGVGDRTDGGMGL